MELLSFLKVILVALLPVGILAYYINYKDKLHPEPRKQLMKAFMFGILSAFASFTLSVPFGILGLYPIIQESIIDSIRISFFAAAIPEESAKLFMLWLVLRNNKFFDEKLDGIVYAVCISLGFAALENVKYLFTNYDAYLEVGIARALFSIPGHFCFGVLMGYYYSLVKFYPKCPQKYHLYVLLIPILVHGIYDSILFTMEISSLMSGLLTLAFLLFCHNLWKYCSQRIREHIDRDNDSYGH